MANPHFLLHLAVILVLSKFVASFSLKLKMPPVLGMIVVGIIIGPSLLDVVKTDVVIRWLAKLGVIMLLFSAGLETDLIQMKSQGRISLYTALGGVVLPFILGYFTSRYFGFDGFSSVLIGTVLMATSVSVTVMTLIEMKRLHSAEGTIILGAAIIDDIIGILMLTFVFGIHGGSEGSLSLSIIKIAVFFVLAFLVGFFLFKPILRFTKFLNVDTGIVTVSLGLCFLYAWFAEKSGIAEITGAYIAGLFLGQTRYKRTIDEGVETLGQSFFVAIFFINIGLETHLDTISGNPLFIIFIVLIAILGKIIGSGTGALAGGVDLVQASRVGFGMVPRGEVALIISAMAMTRGIFTQTEYSTVVLVVIISAISTPPLLKLAFRESKV